MVYSDSINSKRAHHYAPESSAWDTHWPLLLLQFGSSGAIACVVPVKDFNDIVTVFQQLPNSECTIKPLIEKLVYR
jgi:hypothetical protein